MNCPTAVADSSDVADAVISVVAARRALTPVLTCWLGYPAAQTSRALFREAGVPSYETPEEAVRAFMHLANQSRNMALLTETRA